MKYLIRFFLPFVFGVMFGYAWHHIVFKQYIANEKNCYEFILANRYLYAKAQNDMLDELFKPLTAKGEVMIYYDENGRGYKIRRIK